MSNKKPNDQVSKHADAETEVKIAKLEAQLARAVADYHNLEKRFERDSSSIVKFANSALLGKLLEFRDHLELSAKNLSDPSLTMLLSELDKILLEEGVERIDSKTAFDPNSMECAELVPGPDGQVIQVIRPGFKLHDRVLRPARVAVGNGSKSAVIKNKQ